MPTINETNCPSCGVTLFFDVEFCPVCGKEAKPKETKPKSETDTKAGTDTPKNNTAAAAQSKG